jgi:hypothetical protein
LFNFPDFGLSNDESEPVLSLTSLSDEEEEEEEDEWYNIPSNSDSDSNDKAPSAPPPVLPKSSASSTSASGTSTPIRKEHSIGTRIRALTMLNDKVPIARIIKVIGIGRSRIYTLIANAYKRG